MTEERILQALFDTIDKINQTRSDSEQLQKSADTVLAWEGGQLDSLGLINFIVGVEQKLEEEFGATVMLTEDAILSNPEGPLHTIGALASYLTEKLNS